MAARLLRLSALDPYREIGIVVFRIFLGATLVYGTADNVFSGEHMLAFRDFLQKHGFPSPLFSAYLSAYAQFICGLLIAVGFATRWAALVMIVNFLVALGMVHAGLPFSANISPMAMLFGSVLCLFYGPGPMSVDGRAA